MQKIFFSITFLFSVLTCFAQQTIELNNWKFKTGDNINWSKSDFDDSAWKSIKTNESWETQGYPGFDGYGWYRMQFTLPAELNQEGFSDSLRISLGKIDDYDQVFLNGKLIGQNARTVSANTTPEDMTLLKDTKWNVPRFYTIAVNDARLQWGKINVIAVRVFDSGGGGGLHSGACRIGVKGLSDYLVINMNPRPMITDDNGMITKIISLKNTSNIPVMTGLLNMEVVNADTKQVITKQTVPVELMKAEMEYSFKFKGDDSKRFVASFTFTESKTKSSVSQSFQFPYILTPKATDVPKINGAKVFGVRPGSPFLFRIPATGVRPMNFTAENLPQGLMLDAKTGVITGNISARGEYLVKLKATNAKGLASRDLKIVVGDRIALTPPMGWNSWNCFGLSIDQEKVKTTADLFISTGLANHGWTYINVDDGWQSPGEKFPDMKALNDYVHQYGLKTGIYSSPGPQTCGSYQGSYLKEESDAKAYADWGFDYLKYDWCSYGQIARNDGSLKMMQRPYRVMQEALAKQKRDIVYSLCQYGMGEVWKWGDSIGGQAWRTTGDILDNWEYMSRIGFNQEAGAPYAKPGNWNDPDMLVVGWVGLETGMHLTHLTPNEQYTHISLWSLLAAPLLIGCDLTRLDDFTTSLLTNDEVIAIDQDPLGKQGTALLKDATYQVIVKELEDGSKAVGLFNLTENDMKISVPWEALKFNGKQTVRDVWRQKDIGVFNDKYESMVPPHGVVLVKISK